MPVVSLSSRQLVLLEGLLDRAMRADPDDATADEVVVVNIVRRTTNYYVRRQPPRELLVCPRDA